MISFINLSFFRPVIDMFDQWDRSSVSLMHIAPSRDIAYRIYRAAYAAVRSPHGMIVRPDRVVRPPYRGWMLK